MKINKVNHSYQSYNCADGVASVNIYNGNLLFEYPLVSTGMNSFEISTSLVYNSAYSPEDFNGRIIGMGNGWKLNIEQHIFRYESSFNLEGFNENDYVYIDSNWNIHRFVKYYPNDDTTYPMYYYDESGTGLRLIIKNNDFPYEIKDSNDNILQFNSNGLIVKMISSINNEIEKQITYNNFGNLLSIFDIRKPYRKIKYIYDGNFLIDCYVCEEIENNGLIRILNKGKKSYKFKYNDDKLKEIINYTTVEGDSNELNKKNICFEYLQENENKIYKIINATNLTGLLINYNNEKKVSVVTQSSYEINYNLENNEPSIYLGEENYLTNNELNISEGDLDYYLNNNSSKVIKYEYLINDINIMCKNKYFYQTNKTSVINLNNIKLNYYFSDDENLICTLEEKNNTLYTLFDNHGWYIYPSHHNNIISSTINTSTGYILNSNNNFTLNIDSSNFTNFNIDTENDAEYLNISFFVSHSNGEINDFIEYNYSGIKSDGTNSIYISDSVRLEKTKESIWQYVTLPIKILKQYVKIGDVQIKFLNLDNDVNIEISNLQVNRGLYNQLYIYKNGTSYIESNINHCTEIEIDGARHTISKNLYITESDLVATFKNLFLMLKYNEISFDFIFNGGKKVRRVSNIKLIADDNEYEFNIINFTPNYYTKTIYVTDNENEENGKKYTWTIYENQMTYKYDSNISKYYYEVKTICGTTNNIVETTQRLDENQSNVLYNRIYFDGNQKEIKKYDNLITEYAYDEYGNIEKKLVYNENDLSNSIAISYFYEDELDISIREIPKCIQENDITTFLEYDVLNKKIESIKIGNQLTKYEYDIFKENCINIKFENTSTNEEIENNGMLYNTNSDIKSLFSKETKYEFFYNKLGELSSIKNNNIGCLEFNYEKTNTENIYTTNRIKCENNQKELIYREKLKYDKHGNIKELYINNATNPIVTYEYENTNVSDFLKRVVKIEDGFSNKNHEFSYIDNAQIPYSIETINNNDYIKRSSNSLEYKLNTDVITYLYNINTIPVINYTYKTSYSEKQNDIEEGIESFSFLYENDSLNRPNRKVRSYKLCSTCKSSDCNCGENANIIDNIVVDRQISYCDNSILPQIITYNVAAKDEGNNAFNTNNYFYYINTYTNGNISKLKNNGIYFTRNPYNYARSLDFVINENIYNYKYDEFNRLIREDYSISLDYRNENIENVELYYECTYEYDDNSNTLYRKKTDNKDIKFISSNGRLTKIDNNGIITNVNYDDFGNMLNDHNHTYEYNNRGLLSKCIYKKDASTSYVSYYNYDYRGNRYQKKAYVNSYKLFTINYYYDNDTLLGEDWVDENNDVRYKFRYFYDLEGITGFNYWSSSDNGYNNKGYNYNYIKDSLGNINKIMYEGETIGEYVYDAWGNSKFLEYVSINDDSLKRERDFFVLNYNPFRYKGYYYDVETQLYWVSSRYYSPELCRWISPDSIEYLNPESINGLNLYAYCNNDPVNYYDPTGHSAILIGLIIGAIIGAGIGFGTVAYTDYQDDGQIFNGSVKWYEYVGGTVTGAVLGAGVGGIIGAGGAVLSSALVSTGNKFISDLFAYTLTGTPFGTWEDYAVAFISGGLTKGLGMKGIVKAAYDVVFRPAINQAVKIGTNRTETFSVEKYAYDVVTRGLTTLAPSPWKAFYRGGFRSMWDLYKRGYFA